MHKGFSVSLPLLETFYVSALWYVDTILTFLLSCHFSTVTGPKCLAMISPFSSFLSFTSLGMFFLFSFSVPTQSVECLIFSFLVNSGLLKKLSIHRICPWPNKGSKRSSTTAAVLGVSGVIRLDCRTVFLPVYTRKHHKYPALDLHSLKFLFTVCQNFFCHCYAPSITRESTAERSALTENIQGE